MARSFSSWDEVASFGLQLPESETFTSYGKPSIKVRGKAFVATGREAGSFVVMSAIDEKELLIETDPATFWQTDHYRGWPAVLVRYDSAARERIGTVIERGWWDRASKAQRRARGIDRP